MKDAVKMPAGAKVDAVVEDSASHQSKASERDQSSLTWTTTRIELWSFYLYYVVRIIFPGDKEMLNNFARETTDCLDLTASVTIKSELRPLTFERSWT